MLAAGEEMTLLSQPSCRHPADRRNASPGRLSLLRLWAPGQQPRLDLINVADLVPG
jgi:hypothetical protein